MTARTCDVNIEEKVRQDCYNRGYEEGRKNPCDEIVAHMNELQKQVDELQGKNTELQSRVDNLMGDLYLSDGTIARLKERLESVSKTYDKKKDEIERLTEELATAKQELVNEQRYYENAYSRACQLEIQNAKLQKQVDELTTVKADYLKDVIDKTEKETAKEIYTKVKEKSIATHVNIDDNPRKDSFILLSDFKKVIESKGVEVE